VQQYLCWPIEPATLLLKVAISAAGAAVGAVLSDPVAAEATEIKKKVEVIKAAAAQKPTTVAVAEG
jgi:hypothetical protein